MPRPRQRRGGDVKKEEKRMKREAEEQAARAKELAEKRERYKKSEMSWNALPHHRINNNNMDGPEGEHNNRAPAEVDPNALPELDPDTKAYFQGVADKIAELEDLGYGAALNKRNEQAAQQDEQQQDRDDEFQEDERPLLLRSALESLSGNELALAGDNESSVILERLLYSMDDFARRVLADRFTGDYDRLVRHRSASHVLQTLFALAGETVDRESRGIIASAPSSAIATATASSSSSSTANAASLPTMSTLIISVITELLPDLPSLIYDPFGSHALRALLLVVAGRAPTAEGQRGGAERSKRSLQFRKGQGQMKSFLDDSNPSDPKGKSSSSSSSTARTRAVPQEFEQALKTMWTTLEQLETDPTLTVSSSSAGIPGDGVRKAAMDSVAGPAVRILIELEASISSKGWRIGGWADRVLCGLVEEVKKPSTKTEQRSNLREEYLGGLLRHPASAPTFETILQHAPQRIVDAIWNDFFATRLHRLAGNAVANFVVAVALSKLDKDLFAGAVEELFKIARERRAEWIDNSRTGVFKTLLDRAATLETSEKEVAELILDSFGLHTDEERLLAIPCMLSLNRLEYYRKLPSHLTSEATVQGSLLVQSFFHLHSPNADAVYSSLLSIAKNIEALTPLTKNATSSRLIDAFLDSPTTPPRQLRQFLLALMGHYHTLADDRIGSRVVEHCWSVADVFLKDKIAASISSSNQLMFLQQSTYAHFWARKLELPLWERRREEWKDKMRRKDVEAKGLKVVHQATEEELARLKEYEAKEAEKKKKRKKDEVDEIFEAKGNPVDRGSGSKKSKLESNGGGLVDLAAIEEAAKRNEKEKKDRSKKLVHGDGMDDVLKALRAGA